MPTAPQEQTYRMIGRSERSPTRAQNASRLADGCLLNQSSNTCDPVTMIRSGST